MKLLEDEVNKATSFLSNQDADDIEKDIIEAFEAYGIAYKVHDTKRQITFI